MHRVVITGWREGLRKISLTHLIQARTGRRMAEAKRRTDDVLEGHPVVLEVPSEEAALSLVEELRQLGALAEVVPWPASHGEPSA
jgi:hypothetical protein